MIPTSYRGVCFQRKRISFSSTTGLYCCIKFSISVLFGSAVAVSTSPSVQYAGSAASAGNSSIVAGCAGPRSTSIASSSTVLSNLDLILEKIGAWHAQFIFHNLCTKPLL